MNGYVAKFLIVFAVMFIITGLLTYGMVALINPYEPSTIFTGIGFFLITFLPLLFGSMWYLGRGFGGDSKRMRKLMEHGVQAQAEILSVEDTGVTMNDIYPMVRLRLRVHSQTGAPFEAQVETFVSRVNIPRAGDTVRVVYNPADPKNLMLVPENTR